MALLVPPILTPNYLKGNAVLISYPKSGRTWLRYVFHLAGVPMKFTHAGHGTAALDELGHPFIRVKKRVIGRRNIVLHRNVLDTCVSFYFQIHKTDFDKNSNDYAAKHHMLATADLLPPENIVEFVDHPVWGVQNICKFNRAWIDYASGRSNFKVVSYEQIRNNPREYLGQLLEFAGANGYDLEAIIAQSQFDSMKSAEMAGDGKDLRLYGLRDDDPETLKVRKGKVRGYFDYLDASAIARASGTAADYGFEI